MRRQYIIGMLAGWALWMMLFAIGWGFLRGPSFVPAPVGNAAAIAALPIAWGGWVFVWGDGPGQPPAWATAMPFSVVFGLLLYGALGIAASAIYARLRKAR
jgi:ABC-type Na+ efflux pump permease subunit